MDRELMQQARNEYGIYAFTAEEAIEAAIKRLGENGYAEFIGMNCNDYLGDDEVECEGWNGVDRRCDCGNRRVYWETYKDEKTGYRAVAVAY